MFRLILLGLFCFTLLSCHKNIGGFQKSSRETFKAQTQKKDLLFTSENPIFIEQLLPQNDVALTTNATELPIETLALEIENYQKRKNILVKTQKIEVSQKEFEPIKEGKHTEKQSLKLLKRNPVFNDSLKIGLVFLLIAAALAFLPALLQLAVLFAVVAMVFLFIGLKKLFNRRAKIKQKKIRKEKNQLRKEKVKDVFRK